jgi:hypothetical protein
VHDVADLVGLDAGCRADLVDAREDADGLVGRRRWGFGAMGRAVALVDQEKVGEGAADVDA